MKPRIVVKIGTSTLTAGTNMISRGKIENIGRQILALRDQYDIILVSSGAVATAKQFINISGLKNNMVHSKQALSAIGQPKLLQIYAEVFGDFDLKVAQCLMTYKDFDNEESRKNTRNTVDELLNHGFIPIFNENDTVAVEELILGDNDKLSALVASLLEANLLIIASDIEGLFTKNPNLHEDAELIPEVTDLDSISQFIEERENGLGTGGMTSKISAASICFDKGIEVYLVNGARTNFIERSIKGEINFTKFTPCPVK
ncbi:glutamate 5-kinase [Flammeovirga sp. SubArs3]|uniref:glutamate 5-kinase n=1 Tax=Flammeovirga sp. SubArs3 TaxID=2995316 RepID=UPI00248B90EF|nr:glutamate 5-kinase [Flammeovirga sp. SubArs3]